MKILITYFSNTGNTEKIAKSMKDGLMDYDVDMISVKELNPEKLDSYDMILLGSGVYANKIERSVIKLVKKAIPKIPSKFAYFCTHASLEFYQKPFEKVTKIIKEYNCEIIGEFDCVGENLGMPLKSQLEMFNRLPEDQRKKAEKSLEKTKGHPDEKDFENAKKFAISLAKGL